jgi:hypothetical protein
MHGILPKIGATKPRLTAPKTKGKLQFGTGLRRSAVTVVQTANFPFLRDLEGMTRDDKGEFVGV